ncbi:hypothetical protein MUP35_03400 [Patescibacteria group bacterium]|nr:hypothetical protein [Patescibacteria group bacterium]
MERKRSCLETAITRIFAFGVVILVIVGVSIAIEGDWKLIAWVLVTITFVGWVAWMVGCFQREK